MNHHRFFKRKRKEGGCWKELRKPSLSVAAAGRCNNAGGKSMALKALVLLRSAGCDHSSLMHCLYNELDLKKK